MLGTWTQNNKPELKLKENLKASGRSILIFPGPGHLQRTPRHTSVALVLVWVPVTSGGAPERLSSLHSCATAWLHASSAVHNDRQSVAKFPFFVRKNVCAGKRVFGAPLQLQPPPLSQKKSQNKNKTTHCECELPTAASSFTQANSIGTAAAGDDTIEAQQGGHLRCLHVESRRARDDANRKE